MITPELKNAFRHHIRQSYKPRERAQGYVAPMYRGESYAGPNDGIGHAVYALNQARKDTAEGKNRHPAAIKPYGAVSWQPDNSRLAYVEKPESAGLRFVGRVMPECGGRNGIWDSSENCGWYTDPHGDVFRDGTGLCYGVVYQLPGRNGESRFVAGYEFGGTDGGPTLDMSSIYAEAARFYEPVRKSATGYPMGGYWSYQDNPLDMDAARDAASVADSMAQRMAEEEREYQTAWQAGSRYADAMQEAKEARQEALAILKERRAVKTDPARYPALCAAIRGQVMSLLHDLRQAQETARELASGDYRDLCFWTGEKRLQEAFCDGAELDSFPAFN